MPQYGLPVSGGLADVVRSEEGDVAADVLCRYVDEARALDADMVVFPWCRTPERRGVDHNDYPNCSRWFDRVAARPAVQRGVKVLEEHRRAGPHSDKSWEMMFGARQYARR